MFENVGGGKNSGSFPAKCKEIWENIREGISDWFWKLRSGEAATRGVLIAACVLIGLSVFAAVRVFAITRDIDYDGLTQQIMQPVDPVETLESIERGEILGNAEETAAAIGATEIFRESENAENEENYAEESEEEPVVNYLVTEVSPARTMYVNDTLNVRSGAGTNFERIGRLYWSSEVRVTGETDNGWYRIEYNGEEAYIHGDYVQNVSPTVVAEIVFVGDSRTVQMSQVVGSNHYTWIAKSSMGYSWFSSEAVPLINSHCGEGTKILINMGVNDLRNADLYVSRVNELMDSWTEAGAQVYYASVNPVVDGYSNATNAAIAAFNQTLQSSLDSRIIWIDSNSYITNYGYSTTDGLHFTKETTQILYAYYLQCMADSDA